ncbi:MAG: hypothetical protein VYD05_11385, partial [Planctomycetota bacterium]|nr:hypothetical protein [Planctomycetota bacterium]
MRRLPPALLVAAAVAAIAVDVAAQTGRAQAARQRHRSAAALHAAWLQENLDLDASGAIQSYEALR